MGEKAGFLYRETLGKINGSRVAKGLKTCRWEAFLKGDKSNDKILSTAKS